MIAVRKSSERGHFDHGWLNTYHTFSFGGYYDPRHMGFRSLRVINEDHVAAGRGFGTHPHDNMEIITYVLSGALEHRDSMGNGTIIRPGDVQRMTAGTGITHSERNPSATESIHLLQIWILPDTDDLEPSYAQINVADDEKLGRLKLIASPDGAEGSVVIHQDVRIYASILKVGDKLTYDLGALRHVWLQVIRGSLELNGVGLAAGDGAQVSQEAGLTITARDAAELLLFDLA